VQNRSRGTFEAASLLEQTFFLFGLPILLAVLLLSAQYFPLLSFSLLGPGLELPGIGFTLLSLLATLSISLFSLFGGDNQLLLPMGLSSFVLISEVIPLKYDLMSEGKGCAIQQ
jgi:hypothetical protein